MANWNCNYIYDVPPTQDYQEYGVYGESIDTDTVPLEYVGPIYSVLYTGVTSYELNGTTYYNYNLYEIPVFSSTDYDSLSSDLHSNYVVSNTSYSQSFSTSISYNSSSDNSYAVENHGLYPETFNSSYNSFSSLDEIDSSNNENISSPSTQVENHTETKYEDSNSEIVIESHINTPAFTTQAVVNNSIEYNVLEQDNTVSETDIDEDYGDYLLMYEDNQILGCSVQIEDDDMKESEKIIYEKSKISDWSVAIEDDDMKESQKVVYEESEESDWSVEKEDDDMKESEEVIYEENKISDWSVEIEDDDMKESQKVVYEESEESDWSVEKEDDDMKESEEVIYEENKISDWSVEVEDDVRESEKVLYEECVHQSLSTEETTVSDWSVEVPDNHVKTDDDDDFNKVNSSRNSEIDPNYSTVDIKILKEGLYLEALSGHLSLKESVPVVDVLPVIKVESEPVVEHDTLEWVVYDLKGGEENILDGTEKNKASDATCDTYEKSIENHATESTVVFEGMKKKHPNLIENALKTVPIFNLSQQNISHCEGFTIESDEMAFNDDKIQMNETKLLSLKTDSSIETSGKESDLLVENISKLVETDHVFNPVSQKHQSGKENLPEIQNDNIKKMENFAATKIEPWCCNDEALLKSDEEIVKCNEVISNQTGRDYLMNATGHVSLDTGPNGEHYSKANGEKIMENEENASRKRSKKNFKGLRKWFSNLFCCARKKT